MNGYELYGQGPHGPPLSQNPSDMPCPFDNQSIGGMPIPMPMPMPTQATPYPNQPDIYPYLTAPYPAQSTPYPNNSSSYPSHQTAPYPSQPLQAQYSDPGQVMSKPSRASRRKHSIAGSKRMSQPPPFNPMYTVQPTAPPACSHSNSEDSYPPPKKFRTSASSCRVAPLATNTQFVDELTPTVSQKPNFRAFIDALVLRKAIKYFIPDKSLIISILGNQTNELRQNIAEIYKELHRKDLMKQLESRISGKFEELIVAMMTPNIDYYVKEIHDSISGVGTNKDVLIIILCILSNHNIHQICASYENKYGKSLESDIRSNTSDHLKTLLVFLCDGQRDESKQTNKKSAKSDAKRLRSTSSCDLGTNELEFNFIFAQRNVHQLRLIFQEYSKRYHHDISTMINLKFSGNTKKALLTIVECVNNSALYFAKQLNDSMSEIGTDDRKLMFICVTRSEVDMEDIKEAYYQKYGKTLEKRISENTSGDYKNCLIELISLDPRNYYYWITIFFVICTFVKELINSTVKFIDDVTKTDM